VTAPFVDTGHGTGIDARTLRPVLHDAEEFARWRRTSDDPLLDVVEALVRGDLDRAEAALGAATAAPGAGFRLRVLRADLLRDRGRFAEAEALLELLLAEESGTRREAVLRQHLGQVHVAAGDPARARDCFAAALQLRTASGAPPDLLESSRVALARAEEDLAGG
jgi:tetratricopeptide (TPR) repeat protein